MRSSVVISLASFAHAATRERRDRSAEPDASGRETGSGEQDPRIGGLHAPPAFADEGVPRQQSVPASLLGGPRQIGE